LLDRDELRDQVESHSVVLAEDIDISNAVQLQAGLIEHLNEFGPELVLDLSEVRFIDSTGLGVLVSVLKRAREQGGHVTLLNPNREIDRLLQITGLDRVFRVLSGVPPPAEGVDRGLRQTSTDE
jgi:anti-sigma B factor antagonist